VGLLVEWKYSEILETYNMEEEDWFHRVVTVDDENDNPCCA